MNLQRLVCLHLGVVFCDAFDFMLAGENKYCVIFLIKFKKSHFSFSNALNFFHDFYKGNWVRNIFNLFTILFAWDKPSVFRSTERLF